MVTNEIIQNSLRLANLDDSDFLNLNIGDIKYLDPHKLLCAERFYFAIKYKYAEMLDKGVYDSFIEEVYKEHLRAFSNGTFIEPGQESTKNTYNKYKKTFKDLLKSMKEKGFDESKSVVLINHKGLSLDGSHRIGIALYYNIFLPVLQINHKAFNGNYLFFQKRHMKKNMLEYIIKEYCNLKKDVRVLCIWPKGTIKTKKFKQAISLIESKYRVVYRKSISFTKNGLHNFLVECYRDKEWIGSLDDAYNGIKGKLNQIWNITGKCEILVIENIDDERFLQLKNKVREIFNIGTDSVHGTDNDEDTERLLNIILNRSTLYVYNYCKIFDDKKFVLLMRAFRKYLDEEGIGTNDILIDSSGILNLCGIRNAGDIDYLINIPDKKIEFDKILCENHEEDLIYHPESKQELFSNPDNYVCFEGNRFLSLDALIRFKRTRGSKKDKRDLRRIFLFKIYRLLLSKLTL